MARSPGLGCSLGLLLILTWPGWALGASAARDVYVVPFSHLDLWWGGTKEECLSRGNRVISKAIALAKADAKFRFLIEADIFVANYVDSHRGSSELADLKALVRNGQIAISPTWTDIMMDLPDGEAIARNFILGRNYSRKEFGAEPQAASFADLPAFPPQMAQILKLTDTPYGVISRMGPPTPLFDWIAPDGSRARFWFSPRGYDWGATLGLHDELNSLRLSTTAGQVQAVADATAAPVLMHWGLDLYAPTPRLGENLGILNRSLPAYHFQIASMDDYFRAVADRTDVPEVKGEIPSCWPNIVSSIPNLWPGLTPATSVLRSAEAFASINYAMGYADYPQAKLDALWQKLVEACDHNQDGQGGIAGDRRKEEYAAIVSLGAGDILRDSLRNIAERVKIPDAHSAAVVVFNPSIWKRDDVVHAHVTVYGDVAPAEIDSFRRGVRLVDESGASVPFNVDSYSENISRAYEITFVARDVPSLGYRTFYLQPAAETAAPVAAAVITLDAAKDAIESRRALESDVAENDYYRVSIDKTTGFIDIFDKELGVAVVKNMQIAAQEERGGNYVNSEPLSGRILPEVIDAIEVEKNDGVSCVLSVRGTIGGLALTQRLTLFKALKRIDIEDVVAWSKSLNLRLEQLIPYQLADAKLHYGVPFGSNEAGNLVPGSGPRTDLGTHSEMGRQTWLNGRMVHDWIAAAGPDWELAVATDHPYVRLEGGMLRAEMIHGTKYTSVRVVDKNGVGAMHYPQLGTYTFKYSLTSHRGDWIANKTYRFGNDFNNALIPVSATDELSRKELPPTRSFLEMKNDSIVLSALKKEDQGRGLVARFYEIEGRRGDFDLKFDGTSRHTESVNFLEETLKENGSFVAPYEIKTLRILP